MSQKNKKPGLLKGKIKISDDFDNEMILVDKKKLEELLKRDFEGLRLSVEEKGYNLCEEEILWVNQQYIDFGLEPLITKYILYENSDEVKEYSLRDE